MGFSYLVPLMCLELKLLGQVEGRVVELEEILFVCTLVHVRDALVHQVVASLKIEPQPINYNHKA